MGDNVTVEQYYSIMGVEKIIYIEDEIKSRKTWDSIIRDFIVLGKGRKSEIVDGIADLSLKGLLVKIDESIPDGFNWEECPEDGIKIGLETNGCEEALEVFNTIEKLDCNKWNAWMLQYGLGINPSTVNIPKLLFVKNEDATNIPCAIISDWQNANVKFFEEEVNRIESGGKFICIIDDNINTINRAREIIDYINKSESYKNNGIYVVLSSKADPDLGDVGEDIYLEHIQKAKEKEVVEQEAIRALLKSCYNSLLRHYKDTRIAAISKALSFNKDQMNTAILITNFARQEGSSCYESLKQWIELYEEYEFDNSFDMIEKMTKLSWAISNASMGTYISSQAEAKLNSFIDFDKNINKKYSTIQPGDIFEINEKYYILIGQSCDLMLRGDGKRKVSIARLLRTDKISSREKPGSNSGKNSFRTVIIYNYDENYSFKVYCDDSCSVDIRILDLCSFNESGKAELTMVSENDIANEALLTEGQYRCEQNIIKDIEPILKLKKKDVDLHKGLCNQKDPITIFDYVSKDRKVSYNVKRVARIKRYAQLLYRLNLEHEERMGFDVLYTTDIQEIKITLQIGSERVGPVDCKVQYTTNKDNNDNVNKLRWYIPCDRMDKTLKKNGYDKGYFIKAGNFYLFESVSTKGYLGDGKICWEKKCGQENLLIIR